MNQQKRRVIVKSSVMSQFSYCPLIWLFYSRRFNSAIKSIHKRAIRITYQDHLSKFERQLRFSISQNIANFRNRNL